MCLMAAKVVLFLLNKIRKLKIYAILKKLIRGRLTPIYDLAERLRQHQTLTARRRASGHVMQSESTRYVSQDRFIISELKTLTTGRVSLLPS